MNDKSEQRFYLDINNPATCSGTVISWTVCYYGPTTRAGFGASYWATYAVYRRTDPGEGGEERYERVSEMFRAVRATVNFGEHVDGVLQEGFSCYDDSDSINNSTLTIQTGDIIGACIFDPGDISALVDRHQLDIVGEVRGESLSQLQSDANDVCTMDAIPSSIPYSDLLNRDNRRLHIYANIGSYL